MRKVCKTTKKKSVKSSKKPVKKSVKKSMKKKGFEYGSVTWGTKKQK